MLRRLTALFALVLFLGGPQGIAALSHDSLHRGCQAAQSPADSTSPPVESAPEFQALVCWICSALVTSPGEVLTADVVAIDLVPLPIVVVGVEAAPATHSHFASSPRAPPLA